MASTEPTAPRRWGFNRGVRLAAALAAFAIWAAMAFGGGAGAAWDTALYAQLYAADNSGLARNASLLSLLGGWRVLVPIGIVAAIVLAFTRRRRAALLLVTIFVGRLLVEIQKSAVGRDRPGMSVHLEAVRSLSFPSAHAANAMITFLAIALLLPVRQRNRAIAVGIGLAIALQVGWSRVALGVHWPSDVIGGWAFGLFWVALCMRLASQRPDIEPAAGVAAPRAPLRDRLAFLRRDRRAGPPR